MLQFRENVMLAQVRPKYLSKGSAKWGVHDTPGTMPKRMPCEVQPRWQPLSSSFWLLCDPLAIPTSSKGVQQQDRKIAPTTSKLPLPLHKKKALDSAWRC